MGVPTPSTPYRRSHVSGVPSSMVRNVPATSSICVHVAPRSSDSSINHSVGSVSVHTQLIAVPPA